jgi:hypothetical protein
MPLAVAAAMLRWTTTSSNRVESCRIRYVPSLLIGTHQFPSLRSQCLDQAHIYSNALQIGTFRNIYSVQYYAWAKVPTPECPRLSRIENPSPPERLARFHLAAHVERVNHFELHELSQD